MIRALMRLVALDEERRSGTPATVCESKLLRGPRKQTWWRQCFHQIGHFDCGGCGTFGWRSTLCGTSGILSLQKEDPVGSDTTMVVVGVTGPSSERMAALIEEGEMKQRKMEAARWNPPSQEERSAGCGSACGRGFLKCPPRIMIVVLGIQTLP